jgi:hypothetical protein
MDKCAQIYNKRPHKAPESVDNEYLKHTGALNGPLNPLHEGPQCQHFTLIYIKKPLQYPYKFLPQPYLYRG